MTRLVPSLRLRTVGLVALFSFATFAVQAAPTEFPIERPEALTPQTAKAYACADGPEFEGYITDSSSSTTHITETKTGNVYARVSDVIDDWSCTAWYRYSGLAWQRLDGEGNFDWGNLINSTSVSCNWIIDEANYLKANSTNDCADNDAEYAMPIFLAATSTPGNLLEVEFHNDGTPDQAGDFFFIHSDCESYYGAEPISWNQPFTTSDVDTRPGGGTNCDPYDADSTNTTQTIVVDDTDPTGGAISIASNEPWTPTTSVSITASGVSDNLSGVAEMRFSNDGSNWGSWVAYPTLPSWALSSGSGTKTVYAQFRDANGNDTSGTGVSDTIGLDDDDPGSGEIVIASGATSTASQSVSLGLTYGDSGGSGVSMMRFQNESAGWSTYEAIAGTKSWTLSEGAGTKTVKFQFKDAAGNESPEYSDTIVYAPDVTPPGIPATPDLDSGSDTGSSNTDDLTRDDTPTLVGATTSVENDATVKVYDGGSTLVGTGSANGSGAWSITTSSLSDGVHSLTVIATDAASNPSDPSSPLSVTIDTSAPTGPSTPDLDASSDTGASATDDTTSDTTPTFVGTATTGTIVTIYVGGVAKGSGTTAGGTWTVTTSALSEGSLAITATTKDAAGNESSPTSALTVTVDATAPSAPSTPNLDPASDSGVSDTDDITNDVTPTLTGTGINGTTVTILVDAAPVGTGAVSAGVWSVTTSTLPDGEHELTATATDLAGNTSGASSALTVTIDATGPTGTIALEEGSVVTASSSVELDVTSDDPSGVALIEASNDGTTFTELTGSPPEWELESGTGSRTIHYRMTDAAGNSTTLPFLVEVIEPSLSVVSMSCTIGIDGDLCQTDPWPVEVAPSNTYAWTSTVTGCPANGAEVASVVRIGAWTPVVESHGSVGANTFVAGRSGAFTTPSSGTGSAGYPQFFLDSTFFVDYTGQGCTMTISMAWVSGSTPWPENVGMPIEVAPDGTVTFENGATTGDPVQTFSGAFLYSHTDVTTQGRGPSPSVTRWYDSADTRDGLLGPGWTLTYEARLREPDDATGDILFVRPDGNTDRFLHHTGGTFDPSPATRATLVRNPNLSYTVTEVDHTTWTFDPTGRLDAITDRFGNTARIWYDSDDRILVEDPAHRGVLTLELDGGRVTSITDWLDDARTVEYTYDAEDRLETVTDREGETTTFGYDGTSHRLTTITNARDETVITVEYDGEGRVERHVDARGLVTDDETTFSYVVNLDGTRETTTTLPTTSFESTFHPTVEDHYSEEGWLLERITEPSSTETLTQAFTYDGDGFRTSVTNARGYTTNFCYDVDYAGDPVAGSRGNLTRIIGAAPEGGGDRPVTLIAYDADDNVIQTVNPRGVPSGSTVTCSTDLSSIDTDFATDRDFDGTGTNLLKTTTRYTDPDLGARTAITKLEYDDASNPGRVTRAIPARGNTTGTPDPDYATTFDYASSGDQAGMLLEIDRPLGDTTTYAYDAVGRLIETVDAMGNAPGGDPEDHTSTIQYDDEDRIRFIETPDPDGGGEPLVSETRYDEVGNPVVRIDPSGQVTTLAYDERNSLVAVTESADAWTDPGDPPGDVIVTTYAYDAGGSVTRVTRADGDGTYERATDYEVDGRGLTRAETQYPAWPSTSGSLVTSAAYDEVGNRVTLTDPSTNTTTFSYDRLDRLDEIDYADAGTDDVEYDYDAHGNRIEMIDGTGTTTSVWDEADRLVSVTFPGSVTVGYRHDRDGFRTEVIYPGDDSVEYAIDEAGRIESLSDWDARTETYTYSPDGALETVTHPNEVVSTYSYDDARRLTDVEHVLDASTIAEHHYTLDPLGRATALDEGALDWTYAYDRLSRLTDVTGPDGTREYVYDPLGNRLERTIGVTTTTYTHDAADRLLTVDATSITVDADGELTARGSDAFAYDAAHRLTEATVGLTTVTTTYDGDGVRVAQQVDSDPATEFVNDVSVGLPVVLDDGTSRYVWGPAGLAWTVDGADATIILADRLGSVRTSTDELGGVTATARTDEYGVPTASSGSTTISHGYTGEPTDPSGLVSLRARHYDPELGRFLARDTWAGDALDPQSLDRYAYVTNDPINRTDPSGHCGVDIVVDAAFVLFDLAGLAFGPEKDRGTNGAALGADMAAMAIPCVSGAGLVVRLGSHVDDVGDALRLGDDVPTVVFSRNRAPGIAQNFDSAVANGAPTRLTRVNATTRDANRRAALRGQAPAPGGQSLDEYPFACSAQGGCGANVRSVPAAEQSYQGGTLSQFFQNAGVGPGDLFNVRFDP